MEMKNTQKKVHEIIILKRRRRRRREKIKTKIKHEKITG